MVSWPSICEFGGGSSSGRTRGSGPRSGGSNPPPPATLFRRPHRLEAQDTALSRLKHGFESRWGHHLVDHLSKRCDAMGAGKVQSLVTEIEALSEAERQELAHEVLPLLLTTRAGLEEIDRSLEALSDEELDAIIERARQRAGTLGDEAVAAIISEAVRAARTQSRS